MTQEEFASLYNQFLGGTSLTPAGGAADLQALWAGAPAPRTSQPAAVNPSEPYSYFGGMGRSMLNSPAELFGVRGFPFAEPKVEEWRRAYPISNIASQVAGAVVPYGAGIAAGRTALGALGAASPAANAILKSIQVGGAYEKAHPILAASARFGAELLPFELARVGGAALIGDEGQLDDVALSAGLDLALTPIVPAAWQTFKHLAPEAFTSVAQRLKQKLPSYTLEGAPQEQLSQLYAARGTLSAEVLPIAESRIADLERIIRAEGAPVAQKGPYVSQLAGEADAGEIRRLFKTGTDKEDSGIRRRQFIRAMSNGFESSEEVAAELAAAGLHGDWHTAVQYPRTISFRKEGSAADIQKVVGKNLKAVQNGWFVGEETDRGLYVLARKYQGAEQASVNDRWVLFKTNDPNRFVGKDVIKQAADRVASFSTKVESATDRNLVEALIKSTPGSVFEVHRTMRNTAKQALTTPASQRDFDWFKRMFPQAAGATNEAREQIGQAWNIVKHYLTPAQAQFRSAPKAEITRLLAQNIFDTAQAKAAFVNYGEQGLKEGQTIFGKIFGKGEPEGIYGAILKGVQEEDMPAITKVLRGFTPLEEITNTIRAADGAQAKRIYDFFAKLKSTQDKVVQELMKVQELYGLDVMKPVEGRFAPHTWLGDHRQRVFDERGRLIYMASGRSRAEVLETAKNAASRLGGIIKEGPFLADREMDLLDAEQLFRNRLFLKESVDKFGGKLKTQKIRLDVGGFLGDEANLTRKELAEILTSDVQQKYKKIAELVTKHELSNDILDVVRTYGRDVGNNLIYRINQMAGDKGLLNKLQNRGVDKVLAPILGKDSATKVVSAYSKVETHLSILSFNMLHPVLNGVQFVQTMLPKIALTMGATPARLGEFYGFTPGVVGGKHVGPIGVLDPLKVAFSGFKSLRDPDAAARLDFGRAARERVVAPLWAEEFLGSKSFWGKDMRTLETEASPVGAFFGTIKKLSEYPFSKMEELARSHAFMTGRVLAKDVIGLQEPEAVYQFAKQFTLRTMYQYSTADRPKIFNGPMGSLFGLFKNWAFHNISDFSLYAGEALWRKNWTPLLWALAGNGAVAGVGGLPLYGVADQFSKLATNRPLMEWLYSAFGPEPTRASDAIYYGLPALFGVTMQSSAAAPFSNPVRDVTHLTNFVFLDRMAKVGKLLEYTWGQFGQGANPFAYDRTWDLASYALAPRTFYKAFSQVEDGALKAIRNGQPIVTGVDFPQWFVNAFGVTPVRIARAYELSNQLWAERGQVEAATRNLGEAYFQAWQAGDSRAMDLAVQKALGLGLDLGNLMKSALGRAKMQERPILDYEFRTAKDIVERRKLMGLEG